VVHPAAALELVREGPLVSVVLDEPTPVDEVLERIGEEFSIEIKGRLPGAAAGPVRLMKMTLPQVLASVVPGGNFAIVSNVQGEPQRVVVMGEQPGAVPATAGLAPLAQPAPVVRMPGGNDEETIQQIVLLSQQQTAASARMLEVIAMRETSVNVRIAAIHALGNFTQYGAMPFLRTRLMTDPNPEVRIAAAEALQSADYNTAKTLIDQALAAERDENQRQRLQELLDQ
jgi:hypothetical protein